MRKLSDFFVQLPPIGIGTRFRRLTGSYAGDDYIIVPVINDKLNHLYLVNLKSRNVWNGRPVEVVNPIHLSNQEICELVGAENPNDWEVHCD